GAVGRALTAVLVMPHPLLLLLLNAGDGSLALVAHRVQAAEYFALGAIRLICVVPCAYLIGLWYGPAAVGWLRRWPRLQVLAQHPGPVARRTAYVFLLFSLSTAICFFAGAARVRAFVLTVVVTMSVIVRLGLIWLLTDFYAEQVKAVTRFLDNYQV